MRNEVIFDKSEIPDIMVAFTPDELGLPAELRGRKVSEYLISKYPNALINGVPHSLPFQKPAVDINHDKAIELCEAKGSGWHLITNDEWAALFEVCKAMDNERADLLSYVNLFGYNPKYGVSGHRIDGVDYWPQRFNNYMQSPRYTLPALCNRRPAE